VGGIREMDELASLLISTAAGKSIEPFHGQHCGERRKRIPISQAIKKPRPSVSAFPSRGTCFETLFLRCVLLQKHQVIVSTKSYARHNAGRRFAVSSNGRFCDSENGRS
jgi:hypothetical protein